MELRYKKLSKQWNDLQPIDFSCYKTFDFIVKNSGILTMFAQKHHNEQLEHDIKDAFIYFASLLKHYELTHEEMDIIDYLAFSKKDTCNKVAADYNLSPQAVHNKLYRICKIALAQHIIQNNPAVRECSKCGCMLPDELFSTNPKIHMCKRCRNGWTYDESINNRFYLREYTPVKKKKRLRLTVAEQRYKFDRADFWSKHSFCDVCRKTLANYKFHTGYRGRDYSVCIECEKSQ